MAESAYGFESLQFESRHKLIITNEFLGGFELARINIFTNKKYSQLYNKLMVQHMIINYRDL